MLIQLRKLCKGDKFLYDGRLCIFEGYVKEKHWYSYSIPGFLTSYHIDVPTSDLFPLHHMLVEKITDQLVLFNS